MTEPTEEQRESDFRWIQSRVDELSTLDRSSLLALLECVREYPGPYFVQKRRGSSPKRPIEYSVIFPDADRPEPCPPQSFGWDYLGERSEFGEIIFGSHQAVKFPDSLIAWFQRAHPPADLQVQRWIVQELFENYLQNPEAHPSKSYIDPEAFAARYRISLRTFSRQATTLRAQGIVQQCGIVGLQFKDGFIRLTDSGREWAAKGCPAPRTDFSPRVEVNVHLETFVQVITEVAVADVDQETKDEFLTAFQDVQKEPTLERLGRVMGIAANTKELLPPLVKFLADSPAWLATHFLK